MKQTAMQQHIAWLLKHQLTLDIPMEVIEDAEYRLEVEKQQIIDAAERWKGTDFAEKYYSETYGSDEPAKNFWVDDVKYQELIRPASSQVEISDEEIKEAAKDYHWKNGVYYAQEKTFIDAIKWYREQLK